MSAPAVTVQDVLDLQKQAKADRAERRRQEKLASKQLAIHVCWRCGFPALKGIPNSNLVKCLDPDGNVVLGHASPTVCGGSVRAITLQARESVKESGSDFYRILKLRISQLLREFRHSLWTFITEDSNETRGGTRASRENTRGAA